MGQDIQDAKFRITAKDSINLVDKISDTFATWASIVDDIEDTNVKAQLDAVFRDMIKHTVIMEMDLKWAHEVFSAIQEDSNFHPAIKTHAKGFLSEYDKKYVPMELRDVA